ncbi:MAG TPA: DUF2891 family protein [Candidatus Acidoferrales bacterium]|nr:DUF2891 family protein [Candidatus Acidoferrales bacterium]
MSARIELQAALAPRIAPVILANITTHYPYHDAHLFLARGESHDPHVAHPAFGNSFDWHSSVHSHWTAIQLIGYFSRVGENRSMAERLREAIEKNLTTPNIEAEVAYLEARPHYERPYGWAWALKLAADADSLGKLDSLREPLRHLSTSLAKKAIRWVETLPAPIRHGVHGNTAFALGLIVDASRALGLRQLEDAVTARAFAWFTDDRDYPHDWERSGYDFLSPGLAEADLLRRIVPETEFARWWRVFLPDLTVSASFFQVVEVPEIADGAIAHLHGLNLSRAAMIARIAAVLSTTDVATTRQRLAPARMLDMAERLYNAGIEHAVSGDYHATHWLATYAWDAATSLDAARGRM